MCSGNFLAAGLEETRRKQGPCIAKNVKGIKNSIDGPRQCSPSLYAPCGLKRSDLDGSLARALQVQTSGIKARPLLPALCALSLNISISFTSSSLQFFLLGFLFSSGSERVIRCCNTL